MTERLTSPFREATAVPEGPPTEVEQRARRASAANTAALWALVVAFFVPCVRICGRVESPAEVVAKDPPFALVALPTYLLALALALSTMVFLSRSIGPTDGARRVYRVLLALYGLVASGAALAILGGAIADARSPLAFSLGVLMLGAAVTGWVRWRASRRYEPWLGWAALSYAFAAFTVPWLPTVAIGGTMLESWFNHAGRAPLGGYLYLSALGVSLALMGASARSPAREDDRPAPDASAP